MLCGVIRFDESVTVQVEFLLISALLTLGRDNVPVTPATVSLKLPVMRCIFARL
jgi:hypothetical protein